MHHLEDCLRELDQLGAKFGLGFLESRASQSVMDMWGICRQQFASSLLHMPCPLLKMLQQPYRILDCLLAYSLRCCGAEML